MTRAALITTTINVPTNLQDWAACLTPDDVIVVSGDLKTPHAEVSELLKRIYDATGIISAYLHPENQTRWVTSGHVGWNCIQRRNFAILEALQFKPEFIVTVDDDNFPVTDEQVNLYDNAFRHTPTTEAIHASEGWFDVGSFYQPRITHRGYPIPRRVADRDENGTNEITSLDAQPTPIGVYASLWLGDPDIDAIERIVNDPEVTEPFVHTNGLTTSYATLARGTWCPFNSQATAFRAELAPTMFMWPQVGRYDDIWASYVTRKVMDEAGLHVAYGYPWVRQDRNPHDLLVDLGKEVFGMKHTPHMVDVIRGVDLSHYDARDVMTMTRRIYDVITAECDYLPEETTNSFRSWLFDLDDIMKEFNVDYYVQGEIK